MPKRLPNGNKAGTPLEPAHATQAKNSHITLFLRPSILATGSRWNRAWLTVERLPGYAPDLNPIEQLWRNVKTRELANVCAPDLAALRPPLRAGFARVRRQPRLAFAFLRHAGLAF